MTPHTEKEDQLAVLYAYGELDNTEQDAFLGHLRTCPQCQALVEESGRISGLIKFSAEDAPEKTSLEIRRTAGEHCRSEKTLISPWRFTRTLPTIGFVFACAALFILFPWQPEPGKDGSKRVFASGNHDRDMRAQENLIKKAEIGEKLDNLEAEIASFKELAPDNPEMGRV